ATLIFYFSVICATARSTLFPYTTLFRSRRFSASLQYCPDTADHDGGDGSLAAGRIQSAATARGARALGIYSFLGEEDRGRSADDQCPLGECSHEAFVSRRHAPSKDAHSSVRLL